MIGPHCSGSANPAPTSARSATAAAKTGHLRRVSHTGGAGCWIHQLADGHGRPLVVLVGPGQAGDAPMFGHLMAHLRILGTDRAAPHQARPAASR